MKRRRFLVTALPAIVAAPLAVGAETARKIGIVSMTPRSPATDAAWDALLSGLREHGWVEPRTLVIERRYAELPNNSAYAAAEDLVRSGVEVIVVASTPAALAAR